MGVRTLIGTADGTRHAAAMYCSTTGRMVGPIWEAADAEEQIERFQEWLRRLQFMSRAEDIGLVHVDVPPPGCDGVDPRDWPDSGLKKLVDYWRRENVDAESGLLR